MADLGNIVGVNVGSVSGMAVKFIVIVVCIIAYLALMALVIYFVRNYLRYRQYSCVIWSKDAFGNTVEETDKAGVFTKWGDPNKFLWLKKCKHPLECDNIPFVFRGGQRVIYMLRSGLRNYSFIVPVVHNPDVSFSVGEIDVNWATATYESIKKKFSDNLLFQLLPYVIFFVVIIVVLIMVIQLLKNFDVLRDTAVGLRETATAIKEAAEIMSGNPAAAPVVP